MSGCSNDEEEEEISFSESDRHGYEGGSDDDEIGKNEHRSSSSRRRMGSGFGKAVVHQFTKAKKQVRRIRSRKSLVPKPKGKVVIVEGDVSGRSGCMFCFSRPKVLESPNGESLTSDPNDPNFTRAMLTTLLDKNDFCSKECNPHLDLGEEERNVQFEINTYNFKIDSGTISLVVNACSIRDLQDNIVGVCFVAQNITAQKTMMDKFTRLEGDYKEIVLNPNPLIPPIFGTDEFDWCCEWNSAMAKLTGWKREEVMDKLLFGEIFGTQIACCRLRKILESKYGGWRQLQLSARLPSASIWWRDLSLVYGSAQFDGWFFSRISWKIGSGCNTFFWEDPWKEQRTPLKVIYPRLYQISQQKNHFIQRMGLQHQQRWEWQLQWRRPFRECEIQTAITLLEDIQGLIINQHQSDSWKWLDDSRGVYSVKSAYQILSRNPEEHPKDEVYKSIWKMKIPSKVACFLWRLVKDRLPTRINLSKRNIVLPHLCCPFCNNAEEEASHLFFTCPSILPLWWESWAWVGIIGVYSYIPKEFFRQSFLYHLRGKQLSRWLTWWAALTWCTWNHRNNILFHNEPFNGHKLLEDAIFFCWSWLRSLEEGFDIPFHFWSTNLSHCFLF